LNVAQVAARVGFTTPQHFSRVFRRHMDLSPARYRLQERVDKEPGKKQ
jgi:AraC-like DNA-binding protein